MSLGTFKVLSVNHARGTTGMYFNFEIDEVDNILRGTNWHDKKAEKSEFSEKKCNAYVQKPTAKKKAQVSSS